MTSSSGFMARGWHGIAAITPSRIAKLSAARTMVRAWCRHDADRGLPCRSVVAAIRANPAQVQSS